MNLENNGLSGSNRFGNENSRRNQLNSMTKMGNPRLVPRNNEQSNERFSFKFKTSTSPQNEYQKREIETNLSKYQNHMKQKLSLNRIEFVDPQLEEMSIFRKYGLTLLENTKNYGFLLKTDPSSEQKQSQQQENSSKRRRKRKPAAKKKPRTNLYPLSEIHNNWSSFRNVPHFCKVNHGIMNLGNTCFLGGVLQCLFYTIPFRHFLYKKNEIGSMKGKTLNTLKKYLQKNASQKISPFEMVKNLHKLKPGYRIGVMEDSHEILVLLLDKLEQEILFEHKDKNLSTKSKMTNAIRRIFFGKIMQNFESMNKEISNYQSEKQEFFLSLNLNIMSSKRLTNCLETYFCNNVINGFICPITKKKINLSQTSTILEFPSTLIIQLKRFTNDNTKIKKRIKYNITLDLSRFSTNQSSSQSQQNNNNASSSDEGKYELYALLIHYGNTIYHGHYYCCVKGANGFWYMYDDDKRQKITLNEVLSKKPYLMFYKKIDRNEERRFQRSNKNNFLARKNELFPEPIKKKHKRKRKKRSKRKEMVQGILKTVYEYGEKVYFEEEEEEEEKEKEEKERKLIDTDDILIDVFADPMIRSGGDDKKPKPIKTKSDIDLGADADESSSGGSGDSISTNDGEPVENDTSSSSTLVGEKENIIITEKETLVPERRKMNPSSNTNTTPGPPDAFDIPSSLKEWKNNNEMNYSHEVGLWGNASATANARNNNDEDGKNQNKGKGDPQRKLERFRAKVNKSIVPKKRKRDFYYEMMDEGKLPKTKRLKIETFDHSKEFDRKSRRLDNYGKNKHMRKKGSKRGRNNRRNRDGGGYHERSRSRGRGNNRNRGRGTFRGRGRGRGRGHGRSNSRGRKNNKWNWGKKGKRSKKHEK